MTTMLLFYHLHVAKILYKYLLYRILPLQVKFMDPSLILPAISQILFCLFLFRQESSHAFNLNVVHDSSGDCGEFR